MRPTSMRSSYLLAHAERAAAQMYDNRGHHCDISLTRVGNYGLDGKVYLRLTCLKCLQFSEVQTFSELNFCCILFDMLQ